MNEAKEWYVKAVDGNVYGPASLSSLVTWAKDGRIEPGGMVSKDRKRWTAARQMPELEMKWLVEIEPGKFLGPFNRAVIIKAFAEKTLSPTAKAYRLHELAIDEDPKPEVVEVEKVVEKEVKVEVEKVVEKEVEVEKVVEKIVEVPVEKIVEKVVEKEVRVEVPVEKIVEKVVEKEVRVEVPVEKIVEKIVEKEVRVEVPVEKVVEKIVEVPVEKVVEKVVEKIVRVEVPQVVEAAPVVKPPMERPVEKPIGGVFGNMDRERLAALEAAARRELAQGRRIPGFFGR